MLHKVLSISSTKVKVNSNNDIAQKGSTLRSLVWLWTNSPLQRNVPGLSWPHFALWSNIRPNLWKKDSLTWSNVSPNVIKSGPHCIIPRKDEYLTILRCFFQSPKGTIIFRTYTRFDRFRGLQMDVLQMIVFWDFDKNTPEFLSSLQPNKQTRGKERFQMGSKNRSFLFTEWLPNPLWWRVKNWSQKVCKSPRRYELQ